MTKCLVSNTENCKNCYKCIRNCPIKAISFENNRAAIIHENCILCGSCYNVCPQKLKKVRNDVAAVKRLIEGGKVYVSLAPSFVSYYTNSDIQCMRDTLRKLGFEDVEETAVGATIVKKAYDEMLNSGRDVLISSCCHSINLLIRKYHPECLKYLADVLSPMCAHGLNLKQRYGSNAKVVFIGPCISKKDEGDNSDYIDAVLTFRELDEWLEKEKIVLDTTNEKAQDERSKARFFPETGGILKTMERSSKIHDYIAVDGVQNAIHTLEDLEAGKIHNCFIEMSACVGSCINGPISRREETSILSRQLLIDRYAGSEDFPLEQITSEDIRTRYDRSANIRYVPTEAQIEDMLKKMNKEDPRERLNCGCCGYESCRDKAIAIINGHANIDMCLPLLMEKSKSLSDNILDNTPNGLMALDADLNIGLINRSMCRILDIRDPKDVIGQHLAMVMDPSDFYDVFEGKNIRRKKEYLAEYEKYIEKTISFDKKFNILVCVIRDITTEEMSKHAHKELVDNTISITDSLLEKNMTSVHEIASLLGETVAETKVALEKLKGLVKTDE